MDLKNKKKVHKTSSHELYQSDLAKIVIPIPRLEVPSEESQNT
jgi:restriction endonuclease S subunit